MYLCVHKNKLQFLIVVAADFGKKNKHQTKPNNCSCGKIADFNNLTSRSEIIDYGLSTLI